ncbi:MAG: hypothetical protein FWD58_01660 [Firmicutes bacterium]|nr:hypothetical protein [Bacillota bacterium]
MTKYDGIDKAEAKVSPSKEIKAARHAKKGGYFAGLFVRILVAAVLLGAVFGIKAAAFSFSDAATGYVKDAVSYDILGRTDDGEYLIMKSEK